MQSWNSNNLAGRLFGALRRFATDEQGFAAAESVLLALLLTSISVVVGNILYQAALSAASKINQELAGTT